MCKRDYECCAGLAQGMRERGFAAVACVTREQAVLDSIGRVAAWICCSDMCEDTVLGNQSWIRLDRLWRIG